MQDPENLNSDMKLRLQTLHVGAALNGLSGVRQLRVREVVHLVTRLLWMW